jgi:hypothetical protein
MLAMNLVQMFDILILKMQQYNQLNTCQRT